VSFSLFNETNTDSTFLPYGVLCGFFSAVGILMWKLAISIDTPTTTTTTTIADSSDDNRYNHWIIVIIHHIPSLIVGIAMNRLGPKHPFFVTGLIIATLIVFYLVHHFLPGLSLEDWFYSHEELQSSMTSSTTTLLTSSSATSTSATTPTLLLSYLPPTPFGTWFAIWEQYVYWRAVLLGAKQMIALAILYLLRASIHATALKKNTLNLVRRVPIAVTTKDKEGEEGGNNINNDDDVFDDSADMMAGHHRRKSSATSSSSSTMTQKAYDGANQLAKTVRDGVEIVSLSLTDKQALKGKRYDSPVRRNNSINHHRQRPHRKCSIASNATAFVANINTTTTVNINNDNGRISDLLSHRSNFSTTSKSFNEERNNPVIIASSGDDDKTTITKDDVIDYVEIRPYLSDLTVEEIFIEYGFGFFITAICGGVGCCPTIATSNTMYAVGAGSAAPQYLSIFLLLVVFYCSGFEIVQFIPKTAFSSLLVLSAADNIVTWFIKPISKMDTFLEWSVVPVIMLCSVFIGMLNAIVLGIGVSTFIFVAALFQVGVVKFDASGLEIRSRIERSLVQSVWLDTHGDDIRVIVLQNYLFFGNATSILRYVETMFEEIPLNESIRLDFPIPPTPIVLVLDLSLITGMDTSSVDVFMDIWRMCKTNDCKLYVCGLSPRLKKTFSRGGMIPDTKGPRKSRSLLYMSDLDHGLGKAEDVLIHLKMGEFDIQSLFHLEKRGASGFHVALQKIDRLHGLEMSKGLLGLEPYTRIVTLSEGQILFEKDGGVISEKDHGLFFIEVGMIRVEDDSSGRTNTRTGGSTRWNNSLGMNANTLRGKHARLNAAARQAALSKSAGGSAISQSNIMRIATAGPGW
jgi:MFS superfamily sulfate permease-like transporter